MVRLFGVLGAVSAFLAVAAGAFGAHGLKGRLGPEMLSVFDVAARYQMVHAAAVAAGWLFLAGTILFSGSLYGMSLSGIRGLGAITPLGGLAFLAGWAALAWHMSRAV